MIRVAHASAPGRAEGSALVLTAPLSFWGGIDVETGSIIDRAHPERGISVTGRILVLPGGRGSSSSSSVLAESIRRGTGPIGIVLEVPDPILTVGAIVARSLYDVQVPLVVCPISDIATGDRLRILADRTGTASVEWTG
jgi:uncharacterized protein